MDPVWALLLVIGGVFLPLGAVAAYLTHRQRLEDEAAEARDAEGTAAE